MRPADLQEPEASAGQVRRAVDGVMSRPELADAAPGPLDRARSWLLGRLGELLEALAGGDLGALLGSSLLLLAAVALLVAVVRLARGVRRDRAPAGQEPEAAVRRDPATWRRMGRRAEQRGALAEAVRCELRAVLADLAGAGLAVEVAGRTAREELAEVVRASPAAGEPLAEVVACFERAWYGGQVDPDLLERARRAGGEAVRAAARGAAGDEAPAGAAAEVLR